MAQYNVMPRPPWMYSTPYLQDYYRKNQQQVDAEWSKWVSAHPEYANYNPNGQLQPGGGSVGYNPPSQQNWPGGGGMPYYSGGFQPEPYGGGMPSYGSQQSGGGGNWFGKNWPMLLAGGSQLLGAYYDKRSSDKARNQQAQNLQRALAELTPEAMRGLTQQFYTQNYSMLNPAMQSAQRSVAAGAARRGLTGAGVVKQLQAGIPGQFSMGALSSAANQAMGVATQRSGAYAGAPVTAPYSFGGDLNNFISLLGRFGILRNNQQPADTTNKQSNQWWIEGPGHSNVWT